MKFEIKYKKFYRSLIKGYFFENHFLDSWEVKNIPVVAGPLVDIQSKGRAC